MEQFDAIVIGTGQAGPSLAARLSAEGRSVAVLERDRVGGSCVNYGCTPTKALVASARALHVARRGDEFGFRLDGEVQVDMARVKERMRKIAGDSNRGVTGWLEGLDGVELIRGHGRFEGPREVRVAGRRLTAESIFLNVGTRARRPEMPGTDQVELLTSRGLLELDELPEHLVIVGGGYIGLELGQIHRRFGSRVTLVERGPRLLGREDPDVCEAIGEVFRREGIDVRLDSDCIGFEPVADGIAVRLSCAEKSRRVVGSHVLLAVGRIPNTDELGLEAAGVETDERGFVRVDDQLRASTPGIWALGDCNGHGAFTHTAYNDYEIVAANLFDDDPRRVSDRISCYGLFVDPPLGRFGMTEAEARNSGRRVLVGKRPMTKVSRAKEFGETDGFIKVLVDADTEEILGGAILGLSGDEVVHSLLDVMAAGAPYTAISRTVHIHPTVAELVPTTLQDLQPLADPDASE